MSGIIARIAGTLAGSDGDAIVIDCGGVGYAVIVSDIDQGRINARGEGTRITLITRHIVREDRQVLYGFHVDPGASDGWAPTAAKVFDDVCKVQGCGPSTAIKLLSIMAPSRASEWLDGVGVLVDGKGLGKITAEKLYSVRTRAPAKKPAKS